MIPSSHFLLLFLFSEIFIYLFFTFWPRLMARRILGAFKILFPQPGMEPMPPAVEAQSLNFRTTMEVRLSGLFLLTPPAPGAEGSCCS